MASDSAIFSQVFVRSSETILLNLPVGFTVQTLKEEISGRTGVAVDEQVLSYGSQLFDDDDEELALPDNCTIELSQRLLGGKVHGSLARAGKVRGQTPKVEPQEKKKQKTGRAKRRKQYGRRFKNVVAQGPGRRRGPNSNMDKK